MSDAEIVLRARAYLSLETEPGFIREIEDLLRKNDTAELRERFSTALAFGTGGLRGVIGGGGNRMNLVAVRRSTQGLANYIKRVTGGSAGVVIAHDSRRYSSRFALEAALVLASNGVKAVLFPELAPTPFLSFMVRRLRAAAGIVITASHNPPEYNGYKVCWSDGAQIIGEQETGITAEIARVGDRMMGMEESEAKKRGLLEYVTPDDIAAYYDAVLGLFLRREELKGRWEEYPVVYTPLHGAGLGPVTALFDRLGVRYSVVPEQSPPDGDFTHAPVPNPENPGAFELAFKLATKQGAQLVIATDPDADRLGAAVPVRDGFRILSGNELGILFLAYLLETRAEKNLLSNKSYMVKTIVTSELQRRIAEAYNVRCIDTLTGFKYICGVMRRMESESPSFKFILGNEESCGYLIETDVRDKDGVSAAGLAAEMGLHYRTRGLSLPDKLEELYARHGRFRDFQMTKTMPGSAGVEAIRHMMESLRENPTRLLPEEQLVTVKDYRSRTVRDGRNGRKTGALDLPESDVLQFVTASGALVTARPSGTEPKIKFYASLVVEPPCERNEAEQELDRREAAVRGQLDGFMNGSPE